MDEAKHLPSGKTYAADAFAKLPAILIDEYRRDLICVGCNSRAYFVAKRRNGTSNFFGARPHGDDCDLATSSAGESPLGDLEEAPEREARDDVIRLTAHRSKERHSHVAHDPEAEPHRGRARRYTQPTEGGKTTRTVELGLLLRKLIRDKAFRSSMMQLELDSGTATVRDYCVEMGDVRPEHLNRKRLYWGTVHHAKPADGGGAWLLTAYGQPNVLLKADMLAAVSADKGIESLEEFAGSSFIEHGYLNQTRSGGHSYLKPKDPRWFTVRLADQDAEA